MRTKRIWFAEDIALAMEWLSSMSLKAVAAKMGVTDKHMSRMINKARNSGFDAYPMRGE